MASKKQQVQVGPTDDYTERPYEDARRDPEVASQVEGQHVDQIRDYHERFPTLKAEGKVYDVAAEPVEGTEG